MKLAGAHKGGAMRWFAVFLSTVIVWIYVTMPSVREAIRDQTAAAMSQTADS